MEVLNYSEFKVTDAMLASSGKRFANYILDIIVFYIIMLLFGGIYGVYLGLTDTVESNALENPLINFLVSLILRISYYTVLESFLSKTIGKLITKTVVVNEDGSSISFEKALYRSLSRLVPFEPFSFLGTPSRGWHDTWTETYVVDEKIFEEQKEQFYNFKELGIEKND